MTDPTEQESETPGLGCPRCKKPLRLQRVAEELCACVDCGTRIATTECYRAAMVLASTNQGQVEHAAWKETIRNDLLALLLFFLFFIPGRHGLLRKLLPNQFVSSPLFLASSGGLVLVEPYSAPMFLPWSSIVGWRFQTGNALMEIQYATADGQTARVGLQGEEFGEIFDVLQSKFPDRTENENSFWPH